MNIQRCKNGHFFDADRFTECPHCLHNGSIEPDAPERFRQLGPMRLLAEGSTGRVYRIDGREPLALKVVECGTDQGKLQNALYEIQVMERVRGCPGVVELRDDELVMGEDGSWLVYLLEPYCRPLEYVAVDGLSWGKVGNLVAQACEAVGRLRDAGVLHLDIKPGNLFLDASGRVRIGDFGSALFVRDLGRNTSARGTLAYMAPEVYREHRCSERSEIYSLGLVLYYLLNHGKLPFVEDDGGMELAIYKRLAGTELPEIGLDAPKNVRDRVNAILHRACAFAPERRFRSVEEFMAELEEIRDEEQRAWTLKAQAPMPEAHFEPAATRPPTVIDPDPEATSMALPPLSPEKEDRQGDVSPWETSMAAPPLPHGAGMNWGDTLQPASVHEPGAKAPDRPGVPKTPERAPQVQLSKVSFSAVAPRHLVKGEYAVIDLIMYEETYRRVVDELRRQAESETQEKQSVLSVPDAARIRAVLSSPDLDMEESEQTGVWNGTYLDFSFPVFLPECFTKRQVLFTAHIYVNDVLATRLSFTARCSSLFEQKLSVARQDVLTAFVSYASQDRQRVAAVIQGMQAARPDIQVFFDVDSLRVGDDWEKRVYREIEKCDVLYLCWSHFARESQWVDKEWRYAFAQKGIDGIEPIPLEPPDRCPPPKELNGKHFNDKLLYLTPSWSGTLPVFDV